MISTVWRMGMNGFIIFNLVWLPSSFPSPLTYLIIWGRRNRIECHSTTLSCPVCPPPLIPHFSYRFHTSLSKPSLVILPFPSVGGVEQINVSYWSSSLISVISIELTAMADYVSDASIYFCGYFLCKLNLWQDAIRRKATTLVGIQGKNEWSLNIIG